MSTSDSRRCVFCKIVSGELPAKKEYDDENCVVFHDRNPRASVHLLVVAKRHGVEFVSVDDELWMQITRVARLMIEKFKITSSYRIVCNGDDATLVRQHLHMHVLGHVTKERSV